MPRNESSTEEPLLIVSLPVFFFLFFCLHRACVLYKRIYRFFRRVSLLREKLSPALSLGTVCRGVYGAWASTARGRIRDAGVIKDAGEERVSAARLFMQRRFLFMRDTRPGFRSLFYGEWPLCGWDGRKNEGVFPRCFGKLVALLVGIFARVGVVIRRDS